MHDDASTYGNGITTIFPVARAISIYPSSSNLSLKKINLRFRCYSSFLFSFLFDSIDEIPATMRSLLEKKDSEGKQISKLDLQKPTAIPSHPIFRTRKFPQPRPPLKNLVESTLLNSKPNQHEFPSLVPGTATGEISLSPRINVIYHP